MVKCDSNHNIYQPRDETGQTTSPSAPNENKVMASDLTLTAERGHEEGDVKDKKITMGSIDPFAP